MARESVRVDCVQNFVSVRLERLVVVKRRCVWVAPLGLLKFNTD